MIQGRFDISNLFTDDNRLQPILVTWLHEAMGFDLTVIQHTRFYAAKKLRYHARIFYKTVWYQDPRIETNATFHYSASDWLNLIAHEMQHRQDIGNNIFTASSFGVSYMFHWIRNWMNGKSPYYDNPHELTAFAMGCSNDSKVSCWLREHPEFLEELEKPGYTN